MPSVLIGPEISGRLLPHRPSAHGRSRLLSAATSLIPVRSTMLLGRHPSGSLRPALSPGYASSSVAPWNRASSITPREPCP